MPLVNQAFLVGLRRGGRTGTWLCAHVCQLGAHTKHSFCLLSELAHALQVDEMYLFSPLAGIHQ